VGKGRRLVAGSAQSRFVQEGYPALAVVAEAADVIGELCPSGRHGCRIDDQHPIDLSRPISGFVMLNNIMFKCIIQDMTSSASDTSTTAGGTKRF